MLLIYKEISLEIFFAWFHHLSRSIASQTDAQRVAAESRGDPVLPSPP
jgi:hypothetical protein